MAASSPFPTMLTRMYGPIWVHVTDCRLRIDQSQSARERQQITGLNNETRYEVRTVYGPSFASLCPAHFSVVIGFTSWLRRRQEGSDARAKGRDASESD